MKKIFGIFDTRIMIWFHYVILTGVLFAGFYIGEIYFNLSHLNTGQMFFYWFLVLSIGDQLIHWFLGVD